MENPNITIEEYIRFEEEKARSFNDALTSEVALSCEPTVSHLNDNQIDFRISFDESDDEDYTVIYDKNLFSYKIIYVEDLKTDSENDNDKVNIPSFPSPKPTVSYFNDLDYFKDFENEFPSIVYNDALTSKSDFLTEPTIDEFNLKDETPLFECDREEQNVIYFNDLFPFNIIYPDDLKSDKDNDNDKIDIKQSSGDLSIKPLPNIIKINTQGSNKLLETSPLVANYPMDIRITCRSIRFTYQYVQKQMAVSVKLVKPEIRKRIEEYDLAHLKLIFLVSNLFILSGSRVRYGIFQGIGYRRWIRRIRVSWSRDHARIRRIFLDGYGVLVQRIEMKQKRLTSFEPSDSLLEEFADELAHIDSFPSEKDDDLFDFEDNNDEWRNILYHDSFDDIQSDDDDDLFALKSDNDE
ncbi:hypothetical protein Tco_0542849 [Tanacetum coccineum]